MFVLINEFLSSFGSHAFWMEESLGHTDENRNTNENVQQKFRQFPLVRMNSRHLWIMRNCKSFHDHNYFHFFVSTSDLSDLSLWIGFIGDRASIKTNKWMNFHFKFSYFLRQIFMLWFTADFSRDHEENKVLFVWKCPKWNYVKEENISLFALHLNQWLCEYNRNVNEPFWRCLSVCRSHAIHFESFFSLILPICYVQTNKCSQCDDNTRIRRQTVDHEKQE